MEIHDIFCFFFGNIYSALDITIGTSLAKVGLKSLNSLATFSGHKNGFKYIFD